MLIVIMTDCGLDDNDVLLHQTIFELFIVIAAELVGAIVAFQTIPLMATSCSLCRRLFALRRSQN